jgi:hypothetical protein
VFSRSLIVGVASGALVTEIETSADYQFLSVFKPVGIIILNNNTEMVVLNNNVGIIALSNNGD